MTLLETRRADLGDIGELRLDGQCDRGLVVSARAVGEHDLLDHAPAHPSMDQDHEGVLRQDRPHGVSARSRDAKRSLPPVGLGLAGRHELK
jgi:hypothetical protein